MTGITLVTYKIITKIMARRAKKRREQQEGEA
jgi:hypothetical protein